MKIRYEPHTADLRPNRENAWIGQFPVAHILNFPETGAVRAFRDNLGFIDYPSKAAFEADLNGETPPPPAPKAKPVKPMTAKEHAKRYREIGAKIALAETYAGDGALFSAARCYREAADLMEAVQRAVNAELDAAMGVRPHG